MYDTDQNARCENGAVHGAKKEVKPNPKRAYVVDGYREVGTHVSRAWTLQMRLQTSPARQGALSSANFRQSFGPPPHSR